MEICSLASGSSGNSYYVCAQQSKLLIDAGLSGKKIEKALEELSPASALRGILITHEHQDHIQGAGVMSRRYNVPIYITKGTWMAAGAKLGPIAEQNLNLISAGQKFCIGDFEVLPFSISHDAAEPVSYVLDGGQGRAAFLTDTGMVDQGMLDVLSKCDALVLEANHDPAMLREGPYPLYLKNRIASQYGHLSNHQAAKTAAWLLANGRLGKILLGHLSEVNNMPSVAHNAVTNYLVARGFTGSASPHLEVLPRHVPGNKLQVNLTIC